MSDSVPPTYVPPPALTPQPASLPAAASQRGRRGGIGGAVLAVLAVLTGKLKFLIVLLKFGKLLPFTLSMLLTVAIYTALFGVGAAIGIVFLIFVHEMGHVIALRRAGINAGAPMFIPFLGAFIAMRENPRDVLTEAKIAIAGPILGTVGALVMLAVYQYSGSELFLFLAYFGFFINLFNLLPVSPLDGGRVLSAVSIWVNAVGLVLAAGLFFVIPNPFLVLIPIFGAFDLWRRRRDKAANPEYYRISGAARLAVVGVYFLMVVGLGIAQYATLSLLPHHQGF